MSDRPWPMGLALAGAVALAGGGCVLGDVFGSDGLEQVTLTYEGPASMQQGVRRAFSVTVHVNGTVVRNSRVALSVLNDSIVTFTPLYDSLVALNQGTTTLLARFESSLLLDTAITLTQEIKVTGGPP